MAHLEDSHDVLNSVDPDENFFNSFFDSLDQPRQSEYISLERYSTTQTDFPHITIINYNIRSFRANGDEFKAMLQSLDAHPEIIIPTETWLNEDESALYSIEGYNAYHTTRVDSRGGGVSIFCLREYVCHQLPTLSICTNTIESCVVRISLLDHDLYIFAIYRPHSDSIDNFVEQIDGMLHDDALRSKKL